MNQPLLKAAKKQIRRMDKSDALQSFYSFCGAAAIIGVIIFLSSVFQGF